jgi:hypothetical protein
MLVNGIEVHGFLDEPMTTIEVEVEVPEEALRIAMEKGELIVEVIPEELSEVRYCKPTLALAEFGIFVKSVRENSSKL